MSSATPGTHDRTHAGTHKHTELKLAHTQLALKHVYEHTYTQTRAHIHTPLAGRVLQMMNDT